ncbi:unnamed protein product [Sympodiomycopsis kandeliae]
MTKTPVYDTLAAIWHVLGPSYLQMSTNSPLLTWQPGKTPFSTLLSLVATVTLYLATIFGGQALMTKFKVAPMKLQSSFLVHNFLLSVGSSLLLACMLEEIMPIWYHHGFFHAICAADAWTPRMETLYIYNYLFKFWELADTIFLVLKRKPLTLLHTYHHSATAALCFSQLMGKSSISWVVISLNLLVHVIMYAYYFLTTLKIRCPWKRAVTLMQITQFVLDLSIVYFGAYHYFVGAYKLGFPAYGTCSASDDAALSGVFVLSSYLVLFVMFYKNTYGKKRSCTATPLTRSPVREKDQSEALSTSSCRLGVPAISGDLKGRPSTPKLEEAGRR